MEPLCPLLLFCMGKGVHIGKGLGLETDADVAETTAVSRCQTRCRIPDWIDIDRLWLRGDFNRLLVALGADLGIVVDHDDCPDDPQSSCFHDVVGELGVGP